MDHHPGIVSIQRTSKKKKRKTRTNVNATVLGVVQLDITLANCWRFCSTEAEETAASRAMTKNPTATIVG